VLAGRLRAISPNLGPAANHALRATTRPAARPQGPPGGAAWSVQVMRASVAEAASEQAVGSGASSETRK
jgi:hypothetical protein